MIILFRYTTLLTGMTGISLHMQWPLTSQSHGSFSQREQLFFVMYQTPGPLAKLVSLARAWNHTGGRFLK
jgi:hypothetical protein